MDVKVFLTFDSSNMMVLIETQKSAVLIFWRSRVAEVSKFRREKLVIIIKNIALAC